MDGAGALAHDVPGLPPKRKSFTGDGGGGGAAFRSAKAVWYFARTGKALTGDTQYRSEVRKHDREAKRARPDPAQVARDARWAADDVRWAALESEAEAVRARARFGLRGPCSGRAFLVFTCLRAMCVQVWEAQFLADDPSSRGGEECPLDAGPRAARASGRTWQYPSEIGARMAAEKEKGEGREYEAILHDLLADDYAQHAEAYEAAPRQRYGLPFQELRVRGLQGLSALPDETQEDWDRRVHQLRARRGEPLGAYLEGMLAARRSDVEVRRPRANIVRLRRHDACVRCWRAAVATRRRLWGGGVAAEACCAQAGYTDLETFDLGAHPLADYGEGHGDFGNHAGPAVLACCRVVVAVLLRFVYGPAGERRGLEVLVGKRTKSPAYADTGQLALLGGKVRARPCTALVPCGARVLRAGAFAHSGGWARGTPHFLGSVPVP